MNDLNVTLNTVTHHGADFEILSFEMSFKVDEFEGCHSRRHGD